LFFLWLCFFFLSFVFVCGCGVVKEEDRSNKKKEDRWRGTATWGATRSGESLVIQPLQTNNGSRGLLSLPWAFDCSKGLLPSSGFSIFFIKLIYLFIFSFAFSFFLLFIS
jgi:hypothetical protein